MIKSRAVTLFFLTQFIVIILLSSGLYAQQSTSGPEPLPGTDPGLRPPTRSQVVMTGVPAYIWHHGCGPTAVGMVVGFWDGNGFPDLVEGDASTMTSDVRAMIADDSDYPGCGQSWYDHYQDYSCPIDNGSNIVPDRSESGGAHVDNCVADFMHTSMSSYWNAYGWSWFGDDNLGFVEYVDLVLPEANPYAQSDMYEDLTFDDYKEEIDSRRPVVLLVDTDGDGGTDHFVTGIGYDEGTLNYYGIYDTWDYQVHWYRWRPLAPGNSWGIFGLTTFGLDVICVDSDSDGFGDPGYPDNTCPEDNCPSDFNFDQADTDSDGLGDVCDPDIDDDSVPNEEDNCPYTVNPSQLDDDGDAIGNICDNCPDTYNPEQYDENSDGTGDACDGDLHIQSYELPDCTVNEPYFYQFWAVGGVEPYYWQKIGGQPPYGCVFTGGQVGTITGTPTWVGDYYLIIALADSDSPPNSDTIAVSVSVVEPPRPCGDVTGEGGVDIDDAVFLVAYIFLGGSVPDPLEIGDVDCSGQIDIDDVVYMIAYIFTGGPAPCADCE
ncbi:MAG: dockerin type I repeat-containing protein [Candidatus Zixiibacteriota bacterium]